MIFPAYRARCDDRHCRRRLKGDRPDAIAENWMSLRECNRKGCIACNCNCRIETEELLKTTGNHVHTESGNISETGDAVTTTKVIAN